MGPPKGNQNNKKFKKGDTDSRREAYKQYCAWVASGKSRQSFVFEHPTLTCTYKTMDRYIREEPLNFPVEHMETAEAKSLAFWEALGFKMLVGEIVKCQPAIYQMFMRNKFGWDKEHREGNLSRDQAQHEFNKLRKERRPIQNQQKKE